MENDILRFTLRIDRELFKKFRYIADWEGRSANREIEQYIRKKVSAYEEKYGTINIDADK
ncbi:MAG: TraY domain-containing protein [Clostridia bacterium]|nr:TraY domain-containing protein [Clostridia bacterium]